MRTPFICGNWKMYKTVAEALAFADEAKKLVADAKDATLGLGAPFTALAPLAAALAGTNLLVGAQDCYWEKEGAFTGEVSPAMLVEAGCAFVIVGHSERRQFFSETNETVNKKTKAALAAGLRAIVCVGERLEEREAGRTDAVVLDHVDGGLAGLTAADMDRVVIAYEPVWAIGTGKVATPEQAQAVHAAIRGRLAELFGAATAEKVIIQYGGSVKPDNVAAIMAQPDVDGALVGGASLKPDSFAALARLGR